MYNTNTFIISALLYLILMKLLALLRTYIILGFKMLPGYFQINAIDKNKSRKISIVLKCIYRKNHKE